MRRRICVAGVAGARESGRRHGKNRPSLLKQIERLGDLRTDCYVPSYHLALAYAGLGDKDAAFAALSRARDERDPALVHVAVEPRFAPLRTDPRFLALLSELRFPD